MILHAVGMRPMTSHPHKMGTEHVGLSPDEARGHPAQSAEICSVKCLEGKLAFMDHTKACLMEHTVILLIRLIDRSTVIHGSTKYWHECKIFLMDDYYRGSPPVQSMRPLGDD